MTDEGKDQEAAENALDLDREFNKAGSRLEPEERNIKVSTTASAELESIKARESALDSHDAKWIRERDKLSNSSLPTPEFDLGSRAHKSLSSQYDERRTEWEREKEQIEIHYVEQRHEIRENGQTLTSEFSAQQSITKTVPDSQTGTSAAGDEPLNCRVAFAAHASQERNAPDKAFAVAQHKPERSKKR